MRNLETTKNSWAGNSLTKWYLARNPIRVTINFIVVYVSRYLPFLSLKSFLYGLLGAKIGKNVSFGLGATIDIFFPDLIEIGDNTVVGYNSTILCHEFLVAELRKGSVAIGKNVMIGANTTILAGVTIGDNASISAMSLVNRDVSEGERVQGVPIRSVE